MNSRVGDGIPHGRHLAHSVINQRSLVRRGQGHSKSAALGIQLQDVSLEIAMQKCKRTAKTEGKSATSINN